MTEKIEEYSRIKYSGIEIIMFIIRAFALYMLLIALGSTTDKKYDPCIIIGAVLLVGLSYLIKIKVLDKKYPNRLLRCIKNGGQIEITEGDTDVKESVHIMKKYSCRNEDGKMIIHKNNRQKFSIAMETGFELSTVYVYSVDRKIKIIRMPGANEVFVYGIESSDW